MAIIKFENFTGIAPAVDPKKLPEGGAQHANGCYFEAGDLRPLRESKTLPWSASGTLIGKLHWWGDGFLAFRANVDAVNSPVVADEWRRVYWTDGSGSFFADKDWLLANPAPSGAGTPLGIQPLADAPEISLSTAVEPEVVATALSNTTPVRVSCGVPHPFEDGQRVIVTMEPASEYVDPQSPPDRAGMSEILGKSLVVKLLRNEQTGIVNRMEFDLVGADGANWSTYDWGRWRATIKRVYTDADHESRAYVTTLVSKYGEESQPSPPSEVTDVLKGSAVNVQQFIPHELTQFGYTVRLYRSVTGATNTAFMFIKEVPASDHVGNTLTILDDVGEEFVGEVLPSETWAPPPAGLSGLVVMPGGFLAAFKDNTLYFSEPYMPHAWPVAYARTTQDPIVALGVYGQTLVVATQGKPYLASGADPSSVSLQQLDDYAPCAAKRCLTATGTGVIYPTHDGLVHVSAAGVRRLTEAYFTKSQWASMVYSTALSAVWHDGRYVLAATDGVWLFEPHENGIHISRMAGSLATALGVPRIGGMGISRLGLGFQNIPPDSLCYVPGSLDGKLYGFNLGGVVWAEWSSKIVALPRPVSMACGQVLADTYPVSVNLYAGKMQAGVPPQPEGLVHGGSADPFYTVQVKGPEPFRIPGGFSAREWRVDLYATGGVQAVFLASSMDEIKQV